MKATPVLDMYYDFCRKGLPRDGLCNSIKSKTALNLLQLFEPGVYEERLLIAKGIADVYWGYGKSQKDENRAFEFSPLRQNIVLFIAAMRNEL